MGDLHKNEQVFRLITLALQMPCWQIIITNPDNLPGRSVEAMLRTILSVASFDTVEIREIEGGGGTPAIEQAIEDDDRIDVTRLLALLKEVNQFDWATFCLIDGSAEGIGDSPADWAANSYAVVRCVDDQYLYVYTRNDLIASTVQAAYATTMESVSRVESDALEWPS